MGAVSVTPVPVPAGRAVLDVSGPGWDALAALNGLDSPWVRPIRAVLTQQSAQFRGQVGVVDHAWILLAAAPPLEDPLTPCAGVVIFPAGSQIDVDDATAAAWTVATRTGQPLPAAPIRRDDLQAFCEFLQQQVTLPTTPEPTATSEDPAVEAIQPIIDDEAIDTAEDPHAIVSVLRLNGLDISDDLEALPLPELREAAKRLARSPEARAAVERHREEERRAAEERAERARYLLFAIRSDRGTRLDNAAVGAYIRERLHALTFNQHLFIYDRITGLYVEDAGQVGSLIQEIAETVGFDGSITATKREILSYVRDHNIVVEYPFDHYPNALPLSNGVLAIDWERENATLRPYSPEYRFTQKWPAIFDPEADPGPITDVLRQYVDDGEVVALCQLPAQAILHFCGFGPFKRSYIFEGPSNGGKSTYLVDLLNRIFGPENISNVSLQAIGTDRFVTATIGSSVINRCDDLSDVPVENVGPFKALTGGFSHDIERKFQHPYRGRVTAVHAFSTNAPPTVPDNVLYDPAFWNRWIYLRFNNVFEVDPGFVDRTFTPAAVSGLLNEILRVAFEARRTGRLLYEQDPGEVRETWQSAANPFQKFVSEEMQSAQNPILFDKGELFRAFLAWCGANDINPRKLPGTLTGFTQMIYVSGFTTTRRGSKGNNNNRDWRYEARYTWRTGSCYSPQATEGLTGLSSTAGAGEHRRCDPGITP